MCTWKLLAKKTAWESKLIKMALLCQAFIQKNLINTFYFIVQTNVWADTQTSADHNAKGGNILVYQQ